MGNRACAFCLLKSSEDEAVQLNDEEIMAHPYQSAEDLSVHRRPQYSSSPSGANNNVALRTYVNESDIHLNGDSALFTPSREEPAPSSYQKTSSETKAEEEQNALRRQFEQLDVSQLQLKVDAVRTQDYPFLSDAYTMGVIKRSRLLFLLRGPSGLGKSTIASVIAAKYASGAVICSADDYFMHNGTYRFDPSRLRDAHEYCQAKAQTAALSGSCVIIVDNTNIKRWESSFYIKLARENEYVVVEIIPKSAWGYDVDELVKHSRHGVPRETIQRTLGDFEQLRLQYWGWFVNTEDSQLIRSQAEVFFVQCQTNMREFSTALQTLGGFVPGAGPVTSSSYYRGQQSPPRCLHCTAYFCGDKSPALVSAYASREVVTRAVGRAFRLIIIGLYITPRTLGVRVYLQDTQAELYETSETAGNGDTSDYLDDADRAHLTLALAQGQKAVQTGYDQLELMECEATMQPIESCMLNGASAKNYGDGRCVVSFDMPFEVDSMFSAAYLPS